MHSIPLREAGLAEDPEFFALLTRSHVRLVGSALVVEGSGPAWLYREAPFAVVAQVVAGRLNRYAAVSFLGEH